jgi:hypothetical protein
MKRNIMSITTAAALLFATATSAQINIGATTSATVQSATRVSTGGALRSTGSHVTAVSQKAVNTTRNVTTKTVDAAKNTNVQAGVTTQTTAQPKAVSLNSNGNAAANVGSVAQVDAGTQVNSQPVVDKVAVTKNTAVNTTKEAAGKVKSTAASTTKTVKETAGNTNASASSSIVVKSGQ